MDLEKSSTPVPGWYADPEHPGSERYWDGNEWSGQRRPSQASSSSSGAPPSSGFAITALVCGIVGLVTFWIFVGLVLGIIAIVFGVLARKRADNEPAGGRKGLATAGFVLGILAVIATVLYIIAIVAVIGESVDTLNDFNNDFSYCADNPNSSRCD